MIVVAALSLGSCTVMNNSSEEEESFFHTHFFGKPTNLCVFLHLFSFASFFGCSMWVSFVAGLVMFKNMPRHNFGRLQAKLFPRYFQFCLITVGICLAQEVPSQIMMMMRSGHDDNNNNSTSSFLSDTNQCYNLIAIFGILLLNLKYFEPRTTAVMFE